MNEPFSLAFVRPTRFGTLAAVHLPAGLAPVAAEVLERLDPQERALAQGLRGRRQIEFTGGRLAWRALGLHAGPLGSGAAGEPLAPPRVAVSLTHKQELALALAGEAGAGTLGLDLEGDSRERMAIASRVLRPEELAVVEQLPPAEQWRAVLLRFALKEAAYKAIHPHLKRFVGFQEAAASAGPDGSAAVEVFVRTGEPALVLEACWEPLEGPQVLAMVRARRR